MLSEWQFARRVVIVLGLSTLFFVGMAVLWRVARVLLVIFLGILLGLLVDSIARFVARHTPLSRRVAAVLVVVAMLGLAVGLGMAIGPALSSQMDDLGIRLQTASQTLLGRMENMPFGSSLAERLREGGGAAADLSLLTGAASTLIAVGGGIAGIVVVALFGAVQPELYWENALLLVPPQGRARAREIMNDLGCALRSWLKARALAMLFVGLSMFIGLWAIGMELAGVLALIAGLFTFVPTLGPWIGAIPALALAMLMEPADTALVVALFLVVQFLETNVVTPLTQQRVVNFPPALLIAVQLAMAALGGMLGLLVASPLAVVVVVLVQTLYVQDVLEEDITVMGAASPPEDDPNDGLEDPTGPIAPH